MSKGSKNNRIKDWNKYWSEFDQIFKKEKIDNPSEWSYDDLHGTWSRIENGARVWYDVKPEETFFNQEIQEDSSIKTCVDCGKSEKVDEAVKHMKMKNDGTWRHDFICAIK